MNHLRFTDTAQTMLEGLLVPYGGSFNGRDSYGTFASRNTEFCLDWFPVRPFLYHHGLDAYTRATPIGRITTLEKRDAGIWMKAQLDAHNEYIDEIRKLVDAGALGLSSGAMAHLVEIDDKTGEWRQWPIVEGSLTPSPSNLLATVDVQSFKSHCRAAGLETDDALFERWATESTGHQPPDLAAIRATLTAAERDSLPDDDFAYIDSAGGRHLPINDKEHVQNALARFDQTEFESDEAKKRARQRIMAAAERFGVEVSETRAATRAADDAPMETPPSLYERSFEDIRDDITSKLNPVQPFPVTGYTFIVATYNDHVVICRDDTDGDRTYWRVPYTLGSDMEPQLGQAEQVEVAYTSLSARSCLAPLTLDAHALNRHAAALTERTKDLSERRIREGRVLSAANRATITQAADAMEVATRALRDLLVRVDGAVEEAAKAAQFTDPETRRWQIELLELEAPL